MTKYYRHKTYGHVYGIATPSPIGRASWPALVTPKDPPPAQPGQQPGTPRFELSLLLDKASPEVQAFLEAMKTMTSEMLPVFNEGRKAPLGSVKVISDGDEFDKEKYPYYQGNYVLVARNAFETKVYDRQKKEIGREKIIGGQKVLAVVTPLITAHGVSYKLELTQLIEDDGTRFGGGIRDHTSLLQALDGPDLPPETDEEDPGPEMPMSETSTETEPAVKKGKKAAIDLL